MFGLRPYRTAERRLPVLDRPFSLMGDGFDSLLGRMFGRFTPLLNSLWEEEKAVGFEVEDKEKEVLVRLEVPGFDPAEIAVEAGENVLVIRAEHKEKEESKEAPEHRWGRMERMITLPAGADAEKIEAVCKNGLLEIVIPKKPEAVMRKIAVKT
jgi:HSP20 family protein